MANDHKLRVLAWETTRACPLACRHCRAEAHIDPHPDQLTTEEGKTLLKDVADSFGNPIVILSGGEPMTRKDIFELAAYGTSLGLRMTISPDDGRLLTPENSRSLLESGIKRVSFSLHYPDADKNDYFARLDGAFEAAKQGLKNLREAGVSFQINTSVTKRNVDDLPRMLELTRELGAEAWHVFMLVPTGRGKELLQDELAPEEYETALNWLYDQQKAAPIVIQATCAPHLKRIQRQRKREEARSGQAPTPVVAAGHPGGHPGARPGGHPGGHPGLDSSTRGCLTGDGFCFVSHIGEVYGCGFLPIEAGNIREKPFSEIYNHSSLFQELRDLSLLKGKCGICEYRTVCGGCRARAYGQTGDYLGEEPYCIYEPLSTARR